MEFLGIDIGGTKCAVIRGNENGEILAKEKIATSDAESTLEKIFEIAGRLKENSVSVGISCGNPLDSENGIILSPPNLVGWDNIKIVDMVKERLGLPAYLCNDANACAIAEWKFGAGIGSRNMIFMTFGTGMGAGFILDGKLYSGTNGNAGEIGHIRLEKFGPVGYGKSGSVEGFASGGGIAQLGKIAALEKIQCGESTLYCNDISELNKVTAKSIADAAKLGDETAISVYKTTGKMLGRIVSILIDIINPDTIVIGSIYQRSSELLFESMNEVIEKEALVDSRESVKIVPAMLGDELGDVAAVALAIERYKKINGELL